MNPLRRGTIVAIAAAILFGATTPLVKRFGAHTGPFATAALLYAGSALGGGVWLPRGAPSRLAARWKRIAAVALLGAALAPASLAFGLQHSGALAGALLLNCEAVFTVYLARAIYREPLGTRVIVATLSMVTGGVLLALRARAGGESTTLGLVAIVVATFAWALDNTLTRALADFEPREVVLAKSALGGLLSTAFAVGFGEPWAEWWAAIGLVVSGVFGYGFSLRLYLRAQRELGAARTGSLFSVAPFVGAMLAFAAGDREQALLVAGAAVAFCFAIYLHATEQHHHLHHHEPVEHEHAHRHDDGHHMHVHDFEVIGEHTHRHRHEAVEHDHPHGADLHHRHEHD
ncbi:MAG TPA: DMT family transporter [Polyangiaceae bacterium]|nr:DMT family transporter [Polyangiaceae bacterium]